MPVEKSAIYQCTGEDCTVQMEVVYPCCCDQTPEMKCGDDVMEKLEEKTADSSTEKHVPVIEKVDGGYKVTVGSTLHPMEEKHWIQWIELHCASCKVVMRKYLDPGDDPVAFFPCGDTSSCSGIVAREHCNVHGLWKAEG
jgi:superoxide reductase